MKNIIIITTAIIISAMNSNIAIAQNDQLDQFTVKVEGLGCPFCAYGLEKKFNEFKEIDEVKIEMETGVMTFSYPSTERLTMEKVEQQVDAAGYTAVHVKVNRADGSVEETSLGQVGEVDESQLVEESFYVAGNCGMCKARIEKTSESIAGVASANWNKKSKILTVKFDKSQTSKENIEQRIAEVGHDTKSAKAIDATYGSLPGCCQYERRN